MISETYIRQWDKVLSAARCSELIALCNASPYLGDGVAQETDGVSDLKICKELYLREVITTDKNVAVSQQWRAIYEELFDACNPKLIEYVNEFKSLSGKGFADEGFRFKRYLKGEGRFALHIDQTPTTPTRVFAMILYLNDVQEGGETEFPEWGVKVAPRAGRLCIAPCSWTHPHRGNVPLSDDKYIINNFAHFQPQPRANAGLAY
jgi:hypothetical protein